MNTVFVLPQPQRRLHVRPNFVDICNIIVKQILKLQGSQQWGSQDVKRITHHLQLNRPFLVVASLHACLMQLSEAYPASFPAAVTTDDLASNVGFGKGIESKFVYPASVAC